MAQVVSRRPLTKWMWVKSEINACKNCGGRRSSGADSSQVLRLSQSVLFHLPNPLSFPLLVSFHHFSVLAQFSHVSIIPPFLRTHLVFLRQNFPTISPSSFCVPLSASFRHSPY